jgi:hypothetical protein
VASKLGSFVAALGDYHQCSAVPQNDSWDIPGAAVLIEASGPYEQYKMKMSRSPDVQQWIYARLKNWASLTATGLGLADAVRHTAASTFSK